MTQGRDVSPAGVSRRALLGASAGLAAASTAGCIQQIGRLVGASAPGQLSLTVKSVPADADAVATRMARQLVKHLERVGVDAQIELQPPRELRKDVLLDGEYDLYVGRLPTRADPDMLRPLLHSVFEGEVGWQNPFSFTDIAVDDHLTAQRRTTGVHREQVVADLQREVASKQPFGTLVVPNEIWATRTDRFTGWNRYSPTDPRSYFALETRGTDGTAEPRLRVTTTNVAPTRNLNPLAVQHRMQDSFTSLLYDPLARRIDGELTPWLAQDWSWQQAGADAVATVQLRPSLTWHDGRDLTASDVAFTHRFLDDTLLGSGETAAPSPRFRGRSSLVDEVTETGDRTVRFRCPDTSVEVATRTLTVPVLPEHVWSQQTVPASPAWTDGSETTSAALTWPNPKPVGSGAVQFEGRADGESLVLTRFDDHFLHRATTPAVPDVVADGLAFEQLSVRVVPSDHAAVQLLSADQADATAMRIAPDSVPRVGQDDGLELHVADGRELYHVGFNTQRPPLGNPHVRRAIVRLLDKRHMAKTIFDGYAQPASTPLAGTDWVPTALRWDGSDPEVPFVGDDGVLDEELARELFRDAGLEYGDEGRLLDR